MYELAVWIKMLHMTFSIYHFCGNLVQQAYTLQQSCKFTYNYLYSYKHVATYKSLISYLKYFPAVYELAVSIKMLHMTFSPSHSYGNPLRQVYTLQLSCNFTYNYLWCSKHVAIY